MASTRVRVFLAGAAVVIVASIAAPRLVAAERFTLGVSLGRADGQSTIDAGQTRGAFGRLRVTEWIAVQGEVQRTIGDESESTTRRLGGAVLVDLAARDRYTPYLLVGGAVERAERGWVQSDYHAREVGVGLDVRVSTSLTLGIDARVGERELIRNLQPLEISLYAPVLSDGEYASLRVNLGASF
jgi:hypothetical protein